MENPTPEFIEIHMPYGTQRIKIDGPFDNGPITPEDLILLMDKATEKYVVDRLKQQYKDSNRCDYPIIAQFRTALYMKITKTKHITVLQRKLSADNGRLAIKFGFVDRYGKPATMSYQNLWLFIKKRFDAKTIDDLSVYVLAKINDQMKLHDKEFCKNVAHDGIAERSQDKQAKYNDHYEMSMYKGEMGIDTDFLIPIIYESAEGTNYDGHYAVPFAERLNAIEKKHRTGTFDGHYSSLLNYAVLNRKYGMRTMMNIPEDQRRIEDSGKVEEIERWYQKFHEEKDFEVNATLEYKLDFLINHGRIDEVGYYYRNLYVKELLEDKEKYDKEYHRRSLDETMNNMVKNGLVDVETRCNGSGLQNKNLHGKLCIFVLQLVALIRLQHGITENLTSVKDIAC